MRGRTGVYAVGGAVVAASALVASPGTYAWLRRRVGLERDEQYELDRPEEERDEAPIDLREARLSLRARLAEHQELTDDEPAETLPPAPARDAAEPLRREADDARARLRESARAASSRLGG
jgi:hypothetical protein